MYFLGPFILRVNDDLEKKCKLNVLKCCCSQADYAENFSIYLLQLDKTDKYITLAVTIVAIL